MKQFIKDFLIGLQFSIDLNREMIEDKEVGLGYWKWLAQAIINPIITLILMPFIIMVITYLLIKTKLNHAKKA